MALSDPIPDTRPQTIETLKRIVHIHNKNRELKPLIAPEPEPAPEPTPTAAIEEPNDQPLIPAADPDAPANPEEENPPPPQNPVLGGLQVEADGGLFFNAVKHDESELYARAPLDQLRWCLQDLYSQINNFKLLIRMSGTYNIIYCNSTNYNSRPRK